MWAFIFGVVAELVKFLCKLGMDTIDRNADRRKERKEVKKEVDNAKSVRDFFLAVTRYNRI